MRAIHELKNYTLGIFIKILGDLFLVEYMENKNKKVKLKYKTILLMSSSMIQECQYSCSIDLLLAWSSFIY